MTAQVTSLESIEGGRRLRLATPIGAETRRGDSVAVNGVCLTAIDVDATGVAFDVSPETLRVTTLGTFARGRRVNLERPLRADARIGGHFVLGHVDAVGRIRSIRAEGDSHWIEIEFPRELAPLLVPKGSIAVDGISLTVAALNADHFGVQIVPFTRQHTALGEASIGDAVNLEADVLGKHVARLMSTERIGWQS